MAGELVGGAFLSAFLQVAFDRLASREIVDYVQGRKLKEGLLKKLKITLLSINQLLDDAEEKQIRNPNVKEWLHELKDAVFDAEDLLDDIATEYELEMTTSKVRKFFTNASLTQFDKEIEQRIGEVLDNLEHLAKQKDVLGLTEGIGVGAGVGGKLTKRMPTTSLLDESSVYGRDDDKEAIMKLLLSDDVRGSQPPVISIVGMGGMGKTTLAQLVYNHQKVKDHFVLKAWVCISEEFDVINMTKTILEALNVSINDSNNLNLLQHKLKEKLDEKKFLLVLDDVWNQNSTCWELFWTPFNYGAQGSKILVTTRSEKVAKVMHSVPLYHLHQLCREESWKLFVHNAFRNTDPSAYPYLEVIGRNIVDKCEGLPLAIKTLGGMLYAKFSEEEWGKILKSDIWDLSDDESNIIPALSLSYHYLPSSLKRCFAYCSIFPKDYEFNKKELVHLWMAEGLLPQSKKSKRMEEVGEEYFQNLASMSFFQLSDDGGCFVMHDLLNDLAKSVAGDFYFRLEGDCIQDIPQETRHLSFSRSFSDSFVRFKPICNCNRLRSFIALDRSMLYGYLPSKLIHDLIPTLKCMRVLSFSGYIEISELPDSIGNLKHLRYLNLCNTGIRKLPDSICMLHNLQTLKLTGCWSLTELPSDMQKLVNLRHLEFTYFQIRYMPLHMGKLKHLLTLTAFYVGKSSETGINQLGQLSQLQDTLSILQLQNVVDPMEALEANLKNREYLKKLELVWNGNNEDSQKERDVLERLQPYKNLKILTVKGYGGTRFPEWIGDCSSLPNIVHLELTNSKYCLSLPTIGQLPSLKELSISSFDGIEVIGPEFYGNSTLSITPPFRSLETLKFEGMVSWEKWYCFQGENETAGVFACLQEIQIKNCPRLTEHLPPYLPSLRKLMIFGCQQLMVPFPRVPSLCVLQLGTCEKMWRLEEVLLTNTTCLEELFISDSDSLGPQWPKWGFSNNSLRTLFIQHCDSLLSLSLDLFPNLHKLELSSCENLETLSASEGLEKLQELKLIHLKNLKSLPEHMNTNLSALQFLRLQNCPQLESFPVGGIPSNLSDIFIMNCPKLVACRMEWGLQHALCSLRYFSIVGDDTESFPEEGLLPDNIRTLRISGFPNLKSIDYKGLLHLKSLETLSISHCPSLLCFPDEALPKSLSSLEIMRCPLLKKRCEKEKGEDWHKIAHIPHILI
ncbi:Disease resistance protein [Quillaja saponaria]|uniref:Disease resistance protein n=1 Tax=Quillaja saponaria TaxID=32244 RepID=A0AAD7PBZ8_QUISA|nr:Disease resistance protein [Quillaja saponaria]